MNTEIQKEKEEKEHQKENILRIRNSKNRGKSVRKNNVYVG